MSFDGRRHTAALVLGLLTCGAAHAGALRACDDSPALSAAQQDRLLQVAALLRQRLDESGASVALVSRSGLNLQRFGLRYSHAGISLKASAHGAWSVRQLYYACDERRPRLFDQGLAGFVSGTADPAAGHLSIVLLPPAEADALARAALDNARALRLLAATYSANAHAFSLRYQNCNQWLAELLAAAWAPLPDGDDLRARAQQWLRAQGYAPRPVEVGSHALMFAAAFVPWVHLDDHPEADRFALRLQVSLPRSIEDFVRRHAPGARRLELCHDARHVVLREGWTPMGEGCEPEAGDRIVVLD